jgi:hypothetical protein
MKIKYYCIMSHYPICDDSFEYDINNDFWLQTVTTKNENEFDEWVANHPWSWNVVQVDNIEIINE